jgi:hypothetical protein
MTITVSPVSNNQTFGSWLTTTNRLANLISQNVVTSDSSVGGSLTTGNSFVNGHFGAAFVYVANTLSGGNVSTSGVLTLLANVAISNGTSNVVTITANSTESNVLITANNVAFVPSGNVTVGGNTFVVNTANVFFSTTNIRFTNSPLSGNITFNSNTTYNGSVIIANGSLGTNGSVLYSNGAGMYWGALPVVVGNSGIIANADGIFVNANNGIVANATGVYVLQGTGAVVNATGVHVNTAYIATLAANSATFINANSGIVSNATGVYVNTAYIATLAANSATFANGSATNTFTVGTAGYFVTNGNLGIGNSAPAHKLRVEGDISLSGGIHANGALGTAGQFLTSNGTVVYWSTPITAAVTSVATGSGLTGGPITSTGTISVLANTGITANATGIFVNANTGLVANATGVHVNSTYIGTLTSNNSTNLNGQPSTFYTNATNITLGTLDTARLPATANVTTAINVGANVNFTTTTISVGNSTVNSTVNSTSISDSSGNLRTTPVNTSAIVRTLASTDTGEIISTTANVTVNGALLTTGFIVSVFNNSSANITITSGAGVTMYLAGTASTGNRTLAQRGLTTLSCVASNTFVISGAGLT